MTSVRPIEVPRSLLPAAFTLAIWLTYTHTRLNNILVLLMGIYFLVLSWPYGRLNFKRDVLFLLPVALLLCYMVGMLWATGEKAAWQQVEKRLSLVAFPFIFFIGRNVLSAYQVRSILMAFVIACIAIVLYCLFHAGLNIIEHQSLRVVEFRERPYFYFSYLPLTQSASIDPIYLSLYINFSIVVVMNVVTSKLLKVWLVAFLIIANVLVASKIGLLVMVGLMFAFLLRRLHNWTYAIALCVVVGIVSIVLLQRVAFLRDRLFVQTKFEFPNPYSGNWNSVSQRLAIWKCAEEAIVSKFPLGYGTSDGQLALHNAYERNNYVRGIEDNYNVHNEYIYTTLDLGIFGLIVLLAMLATPLVRSWRSGDITFVYFVVICAAYFLVEVVLSRRAGVNFFGFFYGLLATFHYITKKDSVTCLT